MRWSWSSLFMELRDHNSVGAQCMMRRCLLLELEQAVEWKRSSSRWWWWWWWWSLAISNHAAAPVAVLNHHECRKVGRPARTRIKIMQTHVNWASWYDRRPSILLAELPHSTIPHFFFSPRCRVWGLFYTSCCHVWSSSSYPYMLRSDHYSCWHLC
jgi:hypothetical protein